MSSWIWGSSAFDEMVDKATSELNIAGSEDIALNLEISDQIRSKAVQPRDAMRSLKRRLNHQNPNVQILTLTLLDTCVKNGGDHFLAEVASREFMDNLVSILKIPALNRDVRERILKNVQSWAVAFEGKYALSYVGEVYRTLQREGFTFPPKDTTAATAAMVDTATAPEWIDSDVCLRCRTPFTFTNRKHHCRNCGKVYDQACSSKSLPLPHFGIAEPVRVCDACHVLLKKKSEGNLADGKHHLRRSHSHNAPRPPKPKTPRELADEELQRAIELSLKESHPPKGYTSSSWPGASEPPTIDQTSRPGPSNEEEDDPELRAAIEASLRDMQAPKPSAPVSAEDDASSSSQPNVNENELQPLEADAILTFNQTVQEAVSRGTRDLVRYPGFGELFQRANTLEPKMSQNLGEANGKEQQLTDMHEKLSEIVKLYDKILTEQVNNPARRYASMYQPTSSQWNIPPQQPQWNAPPPQQYAVPTQPTGVYQPPQQYAPYSPVQYQQTMAPVSIMSPQQQQELMSPPPPPPVIVPPIQAPAPPAPVSSSPIMQPQQYASRTYAPNLPPVHQQSLPSQPQYQQQQQPAPTPLPYFPSAPTVAPQPYVQPSPVHEQPKEAMLISFE